MLLCNMKGNSCHLEVLGLGGLTRFLGGAISLLFFIDASDLVSVDFFCFTFFGGVEALGLDLAFDRGV